MKTLYLLRHGAPEGAIGTGARCLGSTEAELSPQGRFQAALAGIWLEGQADAIWSSPLNRCRQTAHIAFGTYQVEPDLREIHMGAWDGLPFDTIRAQWPELYRKRGENPIHVVPPGGEAPEEALARMERALLRIAPNHAREGARWLREAGYEKEAEIVLRHHDWDGGAVDEAAVVYWADKRVMGDRVVTMEERFTQSARKCATQEAKEAHDRRRRIAVEIEAQLERRCGRKVEAQDGKERIGS